MPLSEFQASAMDWRSALKQNGRKTRYVIIMYLLMYAGVGLLLDVMLVLSHYKGATIPDALLALVTLHIFPIITLMMFGVAALSILIAFSLHDKIMLLGTEYHEVLPNSRNIREQQLYNVVEEMKVASGMRYLPKIYIIDANYMNAFASGYSERSAMVAITRGLFDKLERAELQAVMAHELNHIRHLDIKLTLTVAILSNIMLIIIDILFYSMIYGRDRRSEDNKFFFFIIILRYALPLITVFLSMFLSRTREFMADAGAVELMRDNVPLARALLKISRDHEENEEAYSQEYGATPHEEVRHAAYIFDPSALDPVKSFTNLLATHPTVEERLHAMGFKK